jgi:hypothetical protein
MTATNELNAANQSICPDNMTRTFLSDGGLLRYIQGSAGAGTTAAGNS